MLGNKPVLLVHSCFHLKKIVALSAIGVGVLFVSAATLVPTKAIASTQKASTQKASTQAELTQKLSTAPAAAETAAKTEAPAMDSHRVFARLTEVTYEKSPDVRLARSNWEQKSSARYTAWTRWAPRVDLRLSDTVSKDYSAATSGSFSSLGSQFNFTPTEVGLKAYQLVLQAPIYNRGVHLGVQKAETERRLARAELDLAKSRVSWSLRQVFGGYLLQAYKHSTVDRSLRLAQSNLQEAQARYRLGSRTVIDVLKAQSQLAQLQARQVTFESDRARALSRLLESTGLEEKELEAIGVLALIGSETAVMSAIETFAATKSAVTEISAYPVERALLAQRISHGSDSLARIELQAKVASAQARTLVVNEWPELFLRATLGKQTEAWEESFKSDSTSYSYGIVLNIPLFSFGSLFSLNREASELVTSTEIKRRQALDELVNTVEDLVLKGRALAKSIESLRYGLEKNDEIERLTLRSYQLGKASFLDLQIAQNDVVESKIQLAQAQIDLAVLVWQMKWNLGSTEIEAGQ